MKTDDLFSLSRKPDSGLFFCSNDPNDIRLGSLVNCNTESYQSSRFVLISCSQDEGISRNAGRVGAARGPSAIRKALYKLSAPQDLNTSDFFDLGDSVYEASLEEIHDRHAQLIEKLLEDGKNVIVLGGGNDLSYPDCKAYRKLYPDLYAINVDAHLDIRKNTQANSGTPYRQLIDEDILQPHRFYEIGIQPHSNSKIYLDHARQLGINLVMLDEAQKAIREEKLQSKLGELKAKDLFLGFDLDAVKASDAPGVSAPSPVGLSGEQAMILTRYLIQKNRVRLLEITEMNPDVDVDGRTAKLAAILIYGYLEECLDKNKAFGKQTQ